MTLDDESSVHSVTNREKAKRSLTESHWNLKWVWCSRCCSCYSSALLGYILAKSNIFFSVTSSSPMQYHYNVDFILLICVLTSRRLLKVGDVQKCLCDVNFSQPQKPNLSESNNVWIAIELMLCSAQPVVDSMQGVSDVAVQLTRNRIKLSLKCSFVLGGFFYRKEQISY